MKEGIQVVTPSRSIPCMIMANIMPTMAMLKMDLPLPVLLTVPASFGVFSTSLQSRFHTTIMIQPQIAAPIKTDSHPHREIRIGENRYTAMVPKLPPQDTFTEADLYSSSLNITVINLTKGGHIKDWANPFKHHTAVI